MPYKYTHKGNIRGLPKGAVISSGRSVPLSLPVKPQYQDAQITEKVFRMYSEKPQRAERHRRYENANKVLIFGFICLFLSLFILGRGWPITVFWVGLGLFFVSGVLTGILSNCYKKVQGYDAYQRMISLYEEDCKLYYAALAKRKEQERLQQEKENSLKQFIEGDHGKDFLSLCSAWLKASDVFDYREESDWREMTAREFEFEVADVYFRLGYDSSTTKESSDGGVDVYLRKDGKTLFVQCKHYAPTTLVGVRELREFYGVCMQHRVEGKFVHTSSLTAEARKFLADKRVGAVLEVIPLDELMLLDREGCTKLLASNNESSSSSSLGFLAQVITNPTYIDCRYYWLYNQLFCSLESAKKTMESLRKWPGMKYAIFSEKPDEIELPVYFIVLGDDEPIRQLSRITTIHAFHF